MNDYHRRYYGDSPVPAEHSFDRNGKALRGSKKSVLFYTTDCGDEKEDLGLKIQQRSVSLTALHTGIGSQQQLLEPRMAQLETLEAKMASIEVSLSTTPRRKKGGSVSGGMTSPAGQRNRDHYKEVDALRVALRDKENIIQTLKGQLCNTLSNRLALRNGAPPLTEADRKATDERLQRLQRDADNKRLAIKNLKLVLERLDITDNIDVRIQQAELEYRLGREELELLTLREESRALQAALELADTQEKQKNDTIFSCISGGTQMTVHAVEVSADPKSPRFGAGPRDDAAGLCVDWAVEDSGLCKGDRILEVNGKMVVGAGRNDLARLLAVAPDAAQIVVLRKSESLAALRTLRSDNLRLTHRIGYLEEQVRDLLAPARPEVTVVETPPPPPPPPPSTNRHEHVQVFQKGPQVTALVANLPGLNVRSPADLRQSLPTLRSGPRQQQQADHQTRGSLLRDSRGTKDSSSLDFSSDGGTKNAHHHKSRSNRQPNTGVSVTSNFQLTGSTASLDCQQSQAYFQQQQRRRSSRLECTMEQLRKTRKSSQSLQPLEFDSEPTYYRMQDNQSRASEYSEVSLIYGSHETNSKTRPAPPKKPLRLSLHRAASLQSMESALPPPPPSPQQHENPRKPTKRNHRGDPPSVDKNGRIEPDTAANYRNSRSNSSNSSNSNGGNNSNGNTDSQTNNPPQPPPRTPSRAESCQSALRWPSPKPRPHLTSVPMEKWC